MTNNKGFTLIELLAVIVILAIILAIAIPGISGIVKSSTMSSMKSDAKLVLKAVELKKLGDKDFNPLDYNSDLGGLLSVLKLSGDNYESVVFTNNNGKILVTIAGKGKWDGLTACGSYHNMIVSEEGCELDFEPPVITLVGDAIITTFQGSVYTDAGATAEDNADGNISANIITTGSVNTDVLDTYTITYNVSDESGNMATPVTRTINVVKPVIVSYGGNSYDSFKDFEILSDGYIAVGQSDSSDGDLNGIAKGSIDAIIVKYDTGGNVLWKKNYGGTEGEQFTSVISESDGYVAVGYSNSNDGDLSGLAKENNDAIIVKYNTNGGVLWKKNYGGTATDSFTNIIGVSDGYIAVGKSSSTDGDLSGTTKGSQDAIIVKYNTSGSVLWKKNFGGASLDSFESIMEISDGYIAVGSSSSTDGDLSGLNKGSTDAIIVKYNTSGNVVWKKTFGGATLDYFVGIKEINDGYIAVGRSSSTDGDLDKLNKGGYDGIIVKHDTSANVVWKKNFGGSGHDQFVDIIVVANEYLVVGKSDSTDVDLAGLNKGGQDGIIVKYNASGDVVLKRNYGGSDTDSFESMHKTNHGYMVSGNTISNDGNFSNLIKKGSSDAILFEFN